MDKSAKTAQLLHNFIHQVVHRFKSYSQCVRDSRWWGSLKMVSAGNKAKRLSSVNHTKIRIHQEIFLPECHIHNLLFPWRKYGNTFPEIVWILHFILFLKQLSNNNLKFGFIHHFTCWFETRVPFHNIWEEVLEKVNLKQKAPF